MPHNDISNSKSINSYIIDFALASSLVLSCLEYCHTHLDLPFLGTSASLIHSPQRTQNNLAKLILLDPSLTSSERLTQLHRLPIYLRINFKISLITYRTLATSNPPISTVSFTAAKSLTTFIHPLQFIYTNQSIDHPSSIETSPVPCLPSGMTFPHHSVSTYT